MAVDFLGGALEDVGGLGGYVTVMELVDVFFIVSGHDGFDLVGVGLAIAFFIGSLFGFVFLVVGLAVLAGADATAGHAVGAGAVSAAGLAVVVVVLVQWLG